MFSALLTYPRKKQQCIVDKMASKFYLVIIRQWSQCGSHSALAAAKRWLGFGGIFTIVKPDYAIYVDDFLNQVVIAEKNECTVNGDPVPLFPKKFVHFGKGVGFSR